VAIKIASWNVEGRLSGYVESGRGSAAQVLDGIEALDADIVILPEAYLEAPADGVDDRLVGMGYEIHDVAYGNKDRDWSLEFMGKMPYLRVLSRLAISQVEEVAWADTRRLLSMRVRDPETGKEALLLPTHFDDRSEELRLDQAEDATEYIKKSDLPVIMAGDFNAMWHKKRARLFGSRLMRFVAKHIPHERIRNKAVQFTDMASGETLERLAAVGLRDADIKLRPTVTPKMRAAPYLPSIPLGQIDHILISEGIEADEYVVSPDMGSDHRAASATIRVK
jgi:endonuclease/exonuclease/phosphatase family metal-dependent hydrolase